MWFRFDKYYNCDKATILPKPIFYYSCMRFLHVFEKRWFQYMKVAFMKCGKRYLFWLSYLPYICTELGYVIPFT